MKTAAVLIDAWKLETFKRHLDAAKYTYKEQVGPSSDIIILKVEFEWAADLVPVIEAANKECRQ